jgi:predicted N-acyltransferase
MPASSFHTGISSKTGNLLTVREYDSIRGIEPGRWKPVSANLGIQLSRSVLEALETSGVEQAAYRYLLFYSGNTLAGAAVLSSFTISLDLLLPISIQKYCRVIRRLLPKFMRIRILICGLPLSAANHALCILDPSLRAEILSGLTERMKQMAGRKRIRFLCLKEFTTPEIHGQQNLRKHGFFIANSIPRIEIAIKWNSYKAYLRDLRHGYRRQIIRNLNRIGAHPDNPFSSLRDRAAENLPRLIRVDRQRCPPDLFYRLYLEVMDRTENKLEVLNEAFFVSLYRAMGDRLVILAVADESSILSAALLTCENRYLTFLFAGIDYGRYRRYDAYHNLLHGIIAYGIEHRCRIINLGQTSYWIKRRIGGVPASMKFWFRSTGLLTHHLLRLLNPVLFPRTDLPELRVFRTPGPANRPPRETAGIRQHGRVDFPSWTGTL